jgi:hypothetical protein
MSSSVLVASYIDDEIIGCCRGASDADPSGVITRPVQLVVRGGGRDPYRRYLARALDKMPGAEVAAAPACPLSGGLIHFSLPRIVAIRPLSS